VAGPDDSAKWRRAVLWAGLAFGAFALFTRIARDTRVVVGLLAVAAFVALVVGQVIWSRRRSQRQIEAGKRSGKLSVEMGLDFSCLPGDWPTMAQDALSPMLTSGRVPLPVLPVRLTAHGGHLEIDKRRSLLLGRAPFHAEVPIAEITDVTVGPPLAGITGSSITIALRGGEELRGTVSVGGEFAEVLAAQLRALSDRRPRSGRAASRGIRVTSPLPPKRTPPLRAWVLMMATLPLALIAIVPQDGVAGYGLAWMAVLYALWLRIRRPASMARRLGIALYIVAIGFVIDAIGFANYAAATDQLVRVAGSLVAVGIGWWMMVSSRSNQGSEHGGPAV
jgi:hypothetical protein